MVIWITIKISSHGLFYHPGPLHKLLFESIYNVLGHVANRQTKQTNVTENIISLSELTVIYMYILISEEKS